MGFFSKIFKGIKKVVKGIGKVIKKVVKSKAFKVIAAVALAVVAPQLIPTIMKGITTAGAWAANTIAAGASAVWTGVQAAGSALMSGARAVGSFGSKVFQSVTQTISKGVNFMKTKLGFPATSTTGSTGAQYLTQAQASQAQYNAAFGIQAGTQNVAKKTIGQKIIAGGKEIVTALAKPITDIAKDPVQKLIIDPITGLTKQAITGGGGGDTSLDRYNEQQRKLSLLGQASNTKAIGAYDSSQGYVPLMTLATNTRSPYLTYNQGQQLFGGLTPTTGAA